MVEGKYCGSRLYTVSRGDRSASLSYYSLIARCILLIAMVAHMLHAFLPSIDCDPAGSLVTLTFVYTYCPTCPHILPYVSLPRVLPGHSHRSSVRGLHHSTVPSSFSYAMLSTLVYILSDALLYLSIYIISIRSPPALRGDGTIILLGEHHASIIFSLCKGQPLTPYNWYICHSYPSDCVHTLRSRTRTR